MAEFKFTATAHVTIKVDAANEVQARAAVFADLHDADTNFIRSDHFDDKSICAEFHLSNVEPTQ